MKQYHVLVLVVVMLLIGSCKKKETNQPTPIKKINYDEKVFVKGGSFMMGSPEEEGSNDEYPQHQVTLNDFYISKYEVTNAQYAKFLNAEGNQMSGESDLPWLYIDKYYTQIEQINGVYKAKAGKENHPVINVNWFGAKAYAEWVGGRLPSEAEWEYAAQGGNKSKNYIYAGGNNIDEIAWHDSNSGSKPNTVGTKQANELGIYDMSGNVLEWCEDTWHDNYNEAPTDGSAWIDTTSGYNILRGGAWYSPPIDCHITTRYIGNPYTHVTYSGLRVVFLP